MRSINADVLTGCPYAHVNMNHVGTTQADPRSFDRERGCQSEYPPYH